MYVAVVVRVVVRPVASSAVKPPPANTSYLYARAATAKISFGLARSWLTCYLLRSCFHANVLASAFSSKQADS